MLRLFRSKRGRPPLEVPPSLGAGQRVYAIGDIHGRVDLLEKLIDKIAADDWKRPEVESTSLVFLGDYVDRGPHSRQVIDFILKLREKWPDMLCLMGNHEQVFQMALTGDEQALKFFLRPGVGGRETMISYGATEEQIDTMSIGELSLWLAGAVPQTHRDFLAGLQDQHLIGDYAFVHAGIQPGVAMEEQEASDLFWIRDEFLNYEKPHPYVVVHGHSIREDVEHKFNRIGIDTGAYLTGRLTAVGLEGKDSWFLKTEAN